MYVYVQLIIVDCLWPFHFFIHLECCSGSQKATHFFLLSFRVRGMANWRSKHYHQKFNLMGQSLRKFRKKKYKNQVYNHKNCTLYITFLILR